MRPTVGRLSSNKAFAGALKIVLIIGLLGLSFGPGMSFCAILLLYGRKWAETDAPGALAAFSVYLFFMAVNGAYLLDALSVDVFLRAARVTTLIT